ncbi:NACHT, LRR and PYD domains-containing protein 1a-like [Sebastes umbrosus]|uniref:NACHT, LRR and PYD domains-containing protein 1a-like n=1 Tax=Sebastes umbrosus TaxID=72105 RepID=UPI00189FBBFB|nr:NACHT, LRR and PYD domains-containing protein 1a-like [Sebastes umbrosus]
MKDSSASTTDSPHYQLSRPPPGTLTEAGMTKSRSSAAGSTPGVNQDDTRVIELHAAAGSSTDDDSDASYHREKDRDESSGGVCFGRADRETRKRRRINRSRHPPLSDPYLHLPSRKDTDDGGPSFNSSSSVSIPPCTQSIVPTVAAPPCLRGRPTVIQESPGRRTTQESESEPGGDGDAQVEMDVTAVNCSVINTQPAHSHLQIFSSHSIPSLSQSTSAHTGTGETSIEEFTPDDDEHDETYRFQCSGPGLYQCSVTGLVFHMEGEGVLVYRTVPWSRRLLVQHHKRPAGPLFDIKCVQQSVCRLHLPHCEIRSKGGGDFLSVAHVTDEDVEFISPHEITETHVIINITGFSGFGNVKDEDSPADPVRALVLLFYKPPADPDPESLLNVLLLPRNVVLRDVLHFRKQLDRDERYIETSPHCKLHPKQEYSLSTRPEDDSVLVQPTEAEFDCDNYDNYFPSFQVDWETIMKHIKLLLRDTNSSHVVWERRVCLSSTGGRRSALNLPPPERLMDIRSNFIDGISGPVLKSLLDKLLEKKVIRDSERESADGMQNNRDKARCVIDTVRKKGEAACSEMIEFLCEADPFLCKDLGLI